MTYHERQPAVIVTREEVRQFAWCAHAILDPSMVHPAQRAALVEAAKDVISWCDGTLLYDENHSDERVLRMKPMAFECKDYFRDQVAEKLDRTPDAVLAEQPIYVAMLQRMAEFIDTTEYSTSARLETLEQFEDVWHRLTDCTEEYVAGIEAEVAEAEDDDFEDETIEMGYNHHASTQQTSW